MVKIVYIFLTILLCQNTFCQKESLGNNAITIVENKKADFLYRGIKNNLRIHMVGMDSINVDHVSIKKDLGNGEFVIMPGKEDKITLIITGYKGGKEVVDERTFRVIEMIRLHGSINGQFKALEMEKEQLLKERVDCVSPNFVYSPPAYHFTVYGFSFKINQGEGFINQGNMFEDKFKEHILQLEKGDQIYIYDIKAIHRGNSSYRLKRILPVEITIR